MTWFTVETTYTTDRDRLAAVRPRHRDYLRGLAERGKVLAAKRVVHECRITLGPWAEAQ